MVPEILFQYHNLRETGKANVKTVLEGYRLLGLQLILEICDFYLK